MYPGNAQYPGTGVDYKALPTGKYGMVAEEGEIDDDPLLGLKSPKLDTKVTESLSEDELRRLIKACGGKGPVFVPGCAMCRRGRGLPRSRRRAPRT